MTTQKPGVRASQLRRGGRAFAYRPGVDIEMLQRHVDDDTCRELVGKSDIDQSFFCIIGDINRKQWKQLSLIPEGAIPHDTPKPAPCICGDECLCGEKNVALRNCSEADLESFVGAAYKVVRTYLTIIMGKIVRLYDVVMSHDAAVQLELLPA